MTTDVEAIQTDASVSAGSETGDSIANDFLNRISGEDGGRPSSEDDEETLASDSDFEGESEDGDSLSSDEPESEGEQTEGDEDEPVKPTPRALSDDDVFTHPVDGEEVTFTIADAKRELGRSKAIQRKEQELASLRKAAEETLTLAETSLKRSYEQARAAYSKYEGINLNVVALREGWDADTLEVVTEQERAAWANLDFYHNQLSQTIAQRKATDKAREDREAQECWNECAHPETGIKGWSLDHYNSLLSYAVQELEFDQEFVAKTTNSKLIKALNRLYNHERGLNAGAKALVEKTKKAAEPAQPLKVIKSSSENQRTAGSNAERTAMERLKREASSENIRDAFLARISKRS